MDPSDPMKSVLLVGNLSSASVGTHFVCEELTDQLESYDWTAHYASPSQSQPASTGRNGLHSAVINDQKGLLLVRDREL